MKQIQAFFWGTIAALTAVVLQFMIFFVASMIWDPTSELDLTYLFSNPYFVIGFAVIEEVFKYTMIAAKIEFLSLKHGFIFNALIAGMGFAAVETGLIFMQQSNPSLRAIIEIAAIHIGTAGMMGYMIAAHSPYRIMTLITTLILTSAIHISYNFLILYPNKITDYAIWLIMFFLAFATLVNLIRLPRKLAQ